MNRQDRYARRRTTNGKSGQQDTKETVMEFVPHIMDKYQTVTYDAVREHILQEMQIDLRNGHEIIECLGTEKKNYQETKPVWQIAVSEGTSNTAEAMKHRQDSYNFEFNIQFKEWVNREGLFKENTYKAYSIIFGYCNKTIQNQIKKISNYDKIRNDPWELLATIKLRMYGQIRAKYEYIQPTDTLVQFLTLKQDHGESLADFNKRFKQAQDNLKGILGTKFMDDYIQNTDKYNDKSNSAKKI